MTAMPPDTLQIRRQAAMAILAHSSATDIAGCLRRMPIPPYEDMRAPESGLIMLRGRIGGDGAPFNLGEATVSRAAVRLSSGETGFGYSLGRDGKKARLIALCDALIQTETYAELTETHVLAPLRAQLADERHRQAEETAATRVDFYTLVRGEAGA